MWASAVMVIPVNWAPCTPTEEGPYGTFCWGSYTPAASGNAQGTSTLECTKLCTAAAPCREMHTLHAKCNVGKSVNRKCTHFFHITTCFSRKCMWCMKTTVTHEAQQGGAHKYFWVWNKGTVWLPVWGHACSIKHIKSCCILQSRMAITPAHMQAGV